jgi:WD40 repeat protein
MDYAGEIASFIHVCTHDSRLSLRDLVLCFQTCRAWQHELESMGFSFGLAWLCATLGRGKDPRDLACRIREMHPRISGRRLDVADQVVRFLLRHQGGIKDQILGADRRTVHGEERERRWAQLASQEPRDSYLSQAVRAMQWFWKDQFIRQRFGKESGYHCCVSAMPKNHDRISKTCVSPDGKMFAYCCEKSPQNDEKTSTIKVCDMSSGLQIRNMQIPSDYIYRMAWSPNNKLLAVCWYCKVRIFDESGDTVCTEIDVDACIPEVRWTIDSQYIIIDSSDGIVRFWDHAGNQKFMFEHSLELGCLAVSNDGCMLAMGGGEEYSGGAVMASLIPLTQGTNPSKICDLEHKDEVTCMAWSPDSLLLAAGERRFGVKFWSRTGDLLHAWTHHFEHNKLCMCWKSNTDTGQQTLQPDDGCPVVGPHLEHPTALAFTPDGKTLACCGFSSDISSLFDGAEEMEFDVIRLWDVENKHEIGYIAESHIKRTKNMVFMQDLSLVTVGYDYAVVRTWDVADLIFSGAATRWPRYSISSIDISPDCTLAATCCTRAWTQKSNTLEWPTSSAECAVSVWDMNIGEVRQTLRTQAQNQAAARQALFNHNSSILASCHDDAVVLWGNILEPDPHIIMKLGPASCIAWTPDSERLARGTFDGEVHVHFTQSGELEHRMTFTADGDTTDSDTIKSLSWLSDCTRLAVFFDKGTVTIFTRSSSLLQIDFPLPFFLSVRPNNDVNMFAMWVDDDDLPGFMGGPLAVIDWDSYTGQESPKWQLDRYCYAFAWHKQRQTQTQAQAQTQTWATARDSDSGIPESSSGTLLPTLPRTHVYVCMYVCVRTS